MTPQNTSLIRKSILFLVAAMLSASAMALDFNQIQREASQGNADAQLQLGAIYYQGKGVRQDYVKARQWYEKAAEQGDSSSQFSMGYAYANGQGVSQDYAKALEWFKKSSNQDNAAAQAYIGIMYEFGQGVPKNKKTAKEWFGKSCDNGYQGGCDDYRKLNEQGH